MYGDCQEIQSRPYVGVKVGHGVSRRPIVLCETPKAVVESYGETNVKDIECESAGQNREHAVQGL